mgnify:CR=1 FL=1
MISLGKLIAMAGGDIQLVMTIGNIMENIGWAIINNLHILFAIAIGIAFAWGVCGEYMWSGEPDMSSAMLIYGGFWLVYMAGFYFAAWDRAKRSVWGYVLLAVAAVLVLRPLVYKQVELTFINFAALPAVLMLHAVTVCFTVPKERQDGLITAYFKGLSLIHI